MKQVEYYVVLVFFAFSFLSFSQTDSTIQKPRVLVEEVFVRGEKKTNNGQSVKKDNNVQLSVDKILASTCGVTLIKRGNYAQEPTVRGLNAGQINTTIDGMQMFGACTDRMDPISSYVEPNNLNSINLNLGPNDEQFGSSIGGGFDFKLMKAKLGAKRFFSGSIGGAYETNASAYQGLASVQLSKKKWAIQANSIYRKSGNYYAGGKREIQFSQFEKWNLGVNGVVQLFKNNTLSVDYLQDNGSNIGYPALLMDVSFANAKIASISHKYRNTKRKFYQLETKAYYNFIDHAMDDTKRPAEMVAMHMDMPGTSMTMGFYSNASIRAAKKHFLKVKLNGYLNDLHAEMTMYPDNGAEMFMLTIPDTRRMLIGVDVSDKFVINNKLNIALGVRGDYSRSSVITNMGRQTLTSIYTGELTRYDFILNAFSQFNYQLNKRLSFSGGVAKATRNATPQEIYGFYLFNRLDNYDYLGNPEILNESSWNVNVGSDFETKKVRLSGQLFGYFFQDYIAGVKRSDYSAMTIGASGVKQYENLDNAMIVGGEVRFQWELVKDLVFFTNNSLSYGEDHEGKALPLIPPFKSVNTIKYTWNKTVFNVTYITGAIQGHVDFDKYGETRSEEFNVLNASVGRAFKLKSSSILLNLTADNIFDAAYSEHLDFMSINRQGRNFILSLTYNFN
ncbi:MAG: TonB-dependent receptor plug domain-containing protein [Crocinitomicaceae bacterium]